MLTLPAPLSASLSFTPEQFEQLCQANPDAVLELSADGQLITTTPTGGDTGARNAGLLLQLALWARSHGGWKLFDSSSGFRRPDGSVLSPDASARWRSGRRGRRARQPNRRGAWSRPRSWRAENCCPGWCWSCRSCGRSEAARQPH